MGCGGCGQVTPFSLFLSAQTALLCGFLLNRNTIYKTHNLVSTTSKPATSETFSKLKTRLKEKMAAREAIDHSEIPQPLGRYTDIGVMHFESITHRRA